MNNDSFRDSNAYTCRTCGMRLSRYDDSHSIKGIHIQIKKMKPTKEVSVYHIDDPFRRQLVEDFDFTYKGKDYTIKRGFWYDGASIPRVFWRSIGSPFTGKYVLPSLIHDMFYATQLLSRKEADICFLEMMKEYGVGWVKRNTMYRAVRLGGWVGYNKSEEDIKKARKKVLINGE